jgi:hypothetical protein
MPSPVRYGVRLCGGRHSCETASYLIIVRCAIHSSTQPRPPHRRRTPLTLAAAAPGRDRDRRHRRAQHPRGHGGGHRAGAEGHVAVARRAVGHRHLAAAAAAGGALLHLRRDLPGTTKPRPPCLTRRTPSLRIDSLTPNAHPTRVFLTPLRSLLLNTHCHSPNVKRSCSISRILSRGINPHRPSTPPLTPGAAASGDGLRGGVYDLDGVRRAAPGRAGEDAAAHRRLVRHSIRRLLGALPHATRTAGGWPVPPLPSPALPPETTV